MRILPKLAALILVATSAHASPEFWVHEWPNTDFDTTTVDSWVEIMSGGPPKDGIPAINAPMFHDVSDEDALTPREPVITLEIDGEVPKAYPIRYLMWHEIVNDQVGGVPVAVTFCPLCNSGMTFDRRVDSQVLTFGVSGKLRNSDMIMFDRETESWWQQAVGTGIVGHFSGVELDTLPSWMESWSAFSTRNPDGLVMQQPDFRRNYGANPYVRYDSSFRPFLYSGEQPPYDIPALARVVRVGDRAWPLSRLTQAGSLTENEVVLSWQAGQASALDVARIGDGKEVGNVRVRDIDGNDLPHDIMFAFAFHAFWPNGEWMRGQDAVD